MRTDWPGLLRRGNPFSIIRYSKLMELFLFLSLFPSNFSIIQLLDPPEIVERPKDVAVRSGGIAAFYCRARGEPTPQLSWRKNGRKVHDDDDDLMTIISASQNYLGIRNPASFPSFPTYSFVAGKSLCARKKAARRALCRG